MTTERSKYVSTVVMDAFREIRLKLESSGRMVAIEQSGPVASIYSTRRSKLEIKYTIRVEDGPKGPVPVVETSFINSITNKEQKSEPELLQRGESGSAANEPSRKDIVASFFSHYRAVAPRA